MRHDPRGPARRSRFQLACGIALAGAAVAALHADVARAQRKTINLGEVVIEGTIQKPEALFILPRTNLDFADLERREDLKKRIVESIEAKPF